MKRFRRSVTVRGIGVVLGKDEEMRGGRSLLTVGESIGPCTSCGSTRTSAIPYHSCICLFLYDMGWNILVSI